MIIPCFFLQVDLSVSGLEKLIGARQALSLFQVPIQHLCKHYPKPEQIYHFSL